MQVQNNQNLSFNGIHSQFTKMNPVQKRLANKLVDGISYTNEYVKACDMGIDLCLFANPKNANGVIVKFLDRASETYVSDKNNKKPLERALSLSGGVEKLMSYLNDIFAGKFPIKDFEIDEVIDNTHTDLCKLYNELKYSEIDDHAEIIDFYKNGKKFD